jgi:hypothetical protein
MTTLTKNLLRFDGWKNLLSGLGSRRDKSRHNLPSPVTRLPDEMLAALYYGDPIAADAVDYLPEDMTKAGFEVDGDNGELERPSINSMARKSSRRPWPILNFMQGP